MKTPHLMFPEHYEGRLSRGREMFNDVAPNVLCVIIGALAAMHPLVPFNLVCIFIGAAAALYGVGLNVVATFEINRRQVHRALCFAWVPFFALWFSMMPGCATDPAATLAAVDERIAQAAAAELDARKAGDDAAALAFAKAAGELRAARGDLAAGIVSQPSPAENAITAAGTAAAGSLGGPVGTIIASAVAVLVPLWQQLKIRKKDAAARSLVRAFDLLRASSPAVVQAMALQKDVIRGSFTPEAARIVEEHRAT